MSFNSLSIKAESHLYYISKTNKKRPDNLPEAYPRLIMKTIFHIKFKNSNFVTVIVLSNSFWVAEPGVFQTKYLFKG